MTACRFLSGINYLVSLDCSPCVIADNVELINRIRSKCKNSKREMLERFVDGQEGRENFNLWVPESQITKSTKSRINLNIGLKRQNSPANR